MSGGKTISPTVLLRGDPCEYVEEPYIAKK